MIYKLKSRVISGESLNKEDIMPLLDYPIGELCLVANQIREYFCKDAFDICTIVNGKSGRCSEDCKFCSQSSHYTTPVEEYPLLDEEELISQARYNFDKGILRYFIVTSGRSLGDKEIDTVCQSISSIRDNVGIDLCASFGLVGEKQLRKMKASGITRIHCNLEASEKYFPNICSTHSYDDKVRVIKSAQKLGLSVCSGGIMGLGESFEDRIDMALELRDLGIKSIPINFLNPIKGTPFENNVPLTDEEKRRIVAIYRFILPDAYIRLAGGRGLIADKGEACFRSGANSAISGDMLTTSGISIDDDMEMIGKLKYRVKNHTH